MALLKSINLALAFLLELCMLIALGYWGFQARLGWFSRIGLGIGTPVLAAILWGTFLAPKAAVHVSGPIKFMLEVMVFGCAVVALAAARHPGLAWTFGGIVVLNKIFLFIWGQ